MAETIRLAMVEDASKILDVSLRAYKPIRDLNIKFLAATADIQLVLNNITRIHMFWRKIIPSLLPSQ
ncbi:hypothetical protein [Niallia sp. 03133]|uniref:hypothetical protein n=1 Tax=Niallia sp. 03133 TaxID=3458060 RepID=UPI00404450B7